MTVNIYQSELLGEKLIQSLQELLNCNKHSIAFSFPKSNRQTPLNNNSNKVLNDKKTKEKVFKALKKVNKSLDSEWYEKDNIIIEHEINPIIYQVESVQVHNSKPFKNTLNYRLFIELLKAFPELGSTLINEEESITNTKTGEIYEMIKGFCLEKFLPFEETKHLESSARLAFRNLEKSFSECRKIREEENIADKDFLILFTEEPLIEQNLFYLIDPSFDNNIIINVKALQELELDNSYSLIAFFIARSILCKSMFSTFTSWYLHQHPKDNRCVMHYSNDLDKLFNMLSHGDICKECEEYLQECLISPEKIRTLLSIIGKSSEKLKRRSVWKTDSTPLPIIIKNHSLDIFLRQLDGTLTKIDFHPSERALYILFLEFENGLDAKAFEQKKDILFAIYSRMACVDEKEDIKLTIDRLTNHKNGAFNHHFSQKKSKINLKINRFLEGNKEMAAYYLIQGDRGKARKINLPRYMVKTTEAIPYLNSIRVASLAPLVANKILNNRHTSLNSPTFNSHDSTVHTSNWEFDHSRRYQTLARSNKKLNDLKLFVKSIVNIETIKLLPAPKAKKELPQACEDSPDNEKEETFVPNNEKKAL